MNIQDGTSQAMKLINELKNQNLLVDFYDQTFQKRLGKYPFLNDDRFNQFDSEHGTDYRHHLLGMYIPPGFDSKKLLKVYTPLKDIFNDKDYPPIFIFINLAIQKVWAIKQSRKGSALILDIGDGQVFDEEIFESNMPPKEFLLLDHAGVVKVLYIALERITRADCLVCSGYGTQRDYRDAISWNLPNINNMFRNLNIQAAELTRNF